MRIDEDKFLTLISILSGLIIFAKLRGDELHIKRGGIKLFNNDSQKMDFRPILAICILLPLDLEHDILTTETCTRDKGIEISFCNFRKCSSYYQRSGTDTVSAIIWYVSRKNIF